ncbi:MAG: 5'-methylthioadenosine/S-adenosylhomocysteine nucleosidase [Bacteroidia bacterium]|nr:5'-methylthioadenosine/S-adenosylhomocysteine nucleosidase [Bacteroidia bacterium]
MIKILILDDSKEKIDITKRFLEEECKVDVQFIDEKYTIKEGRKALYENDYDLLLLDLVMPRDSESEASAEESIKFLDEIYYNSDIHIPVHIIGFSQHDELIELHSDRFEDKLWHLITFSYINNNWKDKLKNKICHLIAVKNRFKESIETKNKFDFAIICALENPELNEVLDLPYNWKIFDGENDPIIYHEGVINTLNGNTYRIIACSINRMGMQATASVSSMIISKFKVKYIFMTGICAGIKERGLNFGDIVIAENAIDLGSGKMTENESGGFIFKPEPHQFPTDQNLISKLNNFINKEAEILKIQTSYKGNSSKTILKAKIGPVASGSYVVASKSMVANIIEPNRKLLAIDMEGYGLYLACHYFNQTKALYIKSVCDFGDEKKDDDYQKYSAYTSARFLYSFIFNML